jgi:hypothetical protein
MRVEANDCYVGAKEPHASKNVLVRAALIKTAEDCPMRLLDRRTTVDLSAIDVSQQRIIA